MNAITLIVKLERAANNKTYFTRDRAGDGDDALASQADFMQKKISDGLEEMKKILHMKSLIEAAKPKGEKEG